VDYQSFQPGGQGQNQVPIPSLSVQLPSSKNFTPKFIGVILIIVALGAGASYGIWWWGSQNSQVAIPTVTPDPTANWKIYRNDQYGFEFRYPEGWFITEGMGMEVFLRRVGSDSFPEMSIQLTPSSSSNLLNQKQESISIDGKNYIKISGESPVRLSDGSAWFLTHIVINNAGKNYEIQADNFDEKLLNQILSTFKFTEPVAGQFCGGIAGIACSSGYSCNLDGNYPDAGGTCVKQ